MTTAPPFQILRHLKWHEIFRDMFSCSTVVLLQTLRPCVNEVQVVISLVISLHDMHCRKHIISVGIHLLSDTCWVPVAPKDIEYILVD